MFAAIDWNEVLMKAQFGAVIGGVGGACASLVAYLARKANDKKQPEAEWPGSTRTHLKARTSKTMSGVFVLLAILMIIAAIALAVKPSVIASLLPAGRDMRKPSATIEDYGRYSSKGPIRTETNRNASGGVNVLSEEGVILLERTDQIPCKVGERWGLRIRGSDARANRPYTVRQETYHPPIKQPDGSVLTKSVRELKVRAGGSPDQFYGWNFLKGYEYELVAGEWTIVVFIDDVEVTRKLFTIRK